jgi:BCCT family betaine/carnitine transporter
MPMDRSKIDWPSFVATVAIILIVCIPLALAGDKAAMFLQQVYAFISERFGIFYLLAAVGAVGFLIWLALSRFGDVRLGDEEIEFSQMSWIAMLFCAGIGAGLMYWCVIEWTYYYDAPPFGVEPQSAAAAEWASTYGMFHWGITAWSFYCLPAIAIAVPYYNRKMDILRFSVSCNWLLRDNQHGPIARLIDFCFMIAMIAGAATGLGLSTPMIAACLAWLFNIEASFQLQVIVMAICVGLFVLSVWLGLQKGIKRLSDINLLLAVALLLFILFAGPTLFLVKTSLNGVGIMAQNFIRMNFWTDPISNTGFVEAWTVFYWAWWVAFAPYVGLFITRISRGRTIRQVIKGMLVFGSLGCWVFYMIIGNYSLFLQLNDMVDVLGVIKSIDASAAIVATLEAMPMASTVITVFTIMSIVFAATTYDSASYTLASSATLHLSAGEDPARWHRVFWAFALAVMPITLLFVGGLDTIKVTLLITSTPILVVGVFMSYSLVKTLQHDVPA